MKKTILLSLFVCGFTFMHAQDKPFFDIAPDMTELTDYSVALAPWDLLYSYSFTNFPLSYVAETDGDFLYVGAWDFNNVDTLLRKYDMQGNFIENLYIPGVTRFRDLAFDGTYMYSGLSGNNGVNKFDVYTQQLIETIPTSFKVRALAYDHDQDCFYANNWSEPIYKFAPDGTVLETIPLTGSFGSYYGFAYDNWSAGGPYLWGFSQDPSHHNIVQMKLPSCTETGFVYDAGGICYSIAGGLFTYEDLDSSRAVIGGVIQNKCLFGLELAPISPPQMIEVGGVVNTASTGLDEGTVDLFQLEFGVVVDQQSTTTDAEGNYLFNDVAEGNYYLQARPSYASGFINTYAPTYLGGQIHWEDVDPFFINTSTYGNNIDLMEILAPGTGIGSVSGFVYEITTDAEIPLENAQILLLNDLNECLAVTYTDADGAYIFENIALGDYGLWVEIVGVSMAPYSFTLTESNPHLSDLMLYVSDGSVMVGIQDEISSSSLILGNFYPNPAKDHASIQARITNSIILDLKTYSISGQLVAHKSLLLEEGLNTIKLETGKLQNGVYYILFEFEDGAPVKRKLIKAE